MKYQNKKNNSKYRMQIERLNPYPSINNKNKTNKLFKNMNIERRQEQHIQREIK